MAAELARGRIELSGERLTAEGVHRQALNPLEVIDLALMAMTYGSVYVARVAMGANDLHTVKAFIEAEERMIKEKVDKLVKSGANVIFCQKGIDDLAQHYLAKHGIYAVRRVSSSDMDNLAKATGARIVSNISEILPDELGSAGIVEERHIGDEDMTYVGECKKAKAVTILIRGGTEHVVDEIKRAVEDAIGDLSSALKTGKVVAGAGAVEVELSKQLNKFADSLSGREQLAVQAFADAIEVIPTTLAENSGLDPIDVLTSLKAAHDKKEKWAGIDVFTGKVVDAWRRGVIEPLRTKTQAITSASEVAIMILRIDDVIASSGSKADRGPSMPPGMPEY